jgi:hypothetical protein
VVPSEIAFSLSETAPSASSSVSFSQTEPEWQSTSDTSVFTSARRAARLKHPPAHKPKTLSTTSVQQQPVWSSGDDTATSEHLSKRKRDGDDAPQDVDRPSTRVPRKKKQKTEIPQSTLLAALKRPTSLSDYACAPQETLLSVSLQEIDLSDLVLKQHCLDRGKERFGFRNREEILQVMKHGNIRKNPSTTHGGYFIQQSDSGCGVTHSWPFIFDKETAVVPTYQPLSPLRVPEHKEGRQRMHDGLLRLCSFFHIQMEDVGPRVAQAIDGYQEHLPCPFPFPWVIDVVYDVFPLEGEVDALLGKLTPDVAKDLGDVEKWVVEIVNVPDCFEKVIPMRERVYEDFSV